MPTRYLSGLLLLLLGVGFLLDQFYGWHLVGTYWPALLILVGLNTLIRHPRHPWWPLVLMVLGVFALARTLDPSHPVRMNPWAVIGAALLIGFGLRLLIPRRERAVTTRSGGATMVHHDERITRSVAFGGAKIRSVSPAFRGGRVSATFGGVEIDLREANLAPEGADLVLDTSFSGIQLRVPVGWPLQVTGAPAFGACEVRVHNTEIAAPNGPALRIACGGAFGGVEITN